MKDLQEHLVDLTEEIAMSETIPSDTRSRTITDRPGAPEHVATATAAEHARGRFAARHPFLMFGVMPLPATLGLFVVLGVGFWLLGECLNLMDEAVPRSVDVAFAHTFVWFCRIIPFATVAAFLTRAYVSSRVSEWWMAAAAGQVLLVAGLFDCRIHSSDVPGQSSLFVGFPALSGPWPPSLHVLLMHMLQVAVPLAIGIVMIRKARRRRSLLLGC
jgi:hypothetical protein